MQQLDHELFEDIRPAHNTRITFVTDSQLLTACCPWSCNPPHDSQWALNNNKHAILIDLIHDNHRRARSSKKRYRSELRNGLPLHLRCVICMGPSFHFLQVDHHFPSGFSYFIYLIQWFVFPFAAGRPTYMESLLFLNKLIPISKVAQSTTL